VKEEDVEEVTGTGMAIGGDAAACDGECELVLVDVGEAVSGGAMAIGDECE
jgi:hypothetical protein